ncbi:NADP-dependent oxidoreductase [Aureisphaera galaxeae]|uniref:NADP-dependent oxidoreductase n=1 Tax=Aureisphaera galaxeae TaxID=1538023 RepID=UPI002350B633|nr:NADP-dependent oxidoreductase [Aureisphaera galaxeae]MDC8004311.1 NADP-dependent oxidoreductase [Aureisphaera galaxeae]
MKAIVLEKAGGIENLVMKEVAQPIIKDEEVLVKVKAISVNPVDYKVRGNEDVLGMICGRNSPIVLGWDIAGTVVAVGDKVTKFNIGDNVFGMINFPGTGSAYAEYVAASEAHLAKIPSSTSFEEAAATTLAALTALQVLKNNVNPGDRVLIHAGSGGVGHFAIQIAKSMGAHVITTSSAKNKDFVVSIGADEHIDYRTEAFQDVLSNIDFVFDMFNGETLYNSVKVVKSGGAIVSIPTPEFSEEILALAKERDVKVLFHMVQSDGEDMNTLKDMLESGAVKPQISKSFPFDQMAKAHEQLESGRTVGKVIVKL